MGDPSLYSPLSENGKSTYSISWRETRFALTTPPVAKIELYRLRKAGAGAAGGNGRRPERHLRSSSRPNGKVASTGAVGIPAASSTRAVQ
jgi:hypothetical protein